MTARAWRYIPGFAIGSVFAVLAWWGSPGSIPIDPDAQRHVMNGALLADMIRDRGWTHPITYATRYYVSYPALSLPYHPPVFPVMEAAAFAFFGVRYDVARALIALSLIGCAVLLYTLILLTHASPPLAFWSTAVFCALPATAALSREVMLEIPSLLFVLAAMHVMAVWLTGVKPQPRAGMAFAALAALAIWTKQQNIFLAGTPICYLVLAGRWRWLASRWLWTPVLIVGIAAAGVLTLPKLANLGNTGWKDWPLHQTIGHHVAFYSNAIWRNFGPVPAIALIAASCVYMVRKWRASAEGRYCDIYAAWALSCAALLLVIPPWDARYATHLAPAAVVLLLSSALSRPRLLGRRTVVPVLATGMILFSGRLRPAAGLYGYEEAARRIVSLQSRRALYCGSRNGAFVYGLRKAQPRAAGILIRADQVPAEVLTDSSEAHRFLYEYAIDTVVIDRPAPGCEVLAEAPSIEAAFRSAIYKEHGTSTGSVAVYRNTHLSSNPKNAFRPRSGIRRDPGQVNF
jgi:hypothetical protein